MKQLFAVLLLTTSTLSIAACELQFDVKKSGAKTAYINGVSVSSKIREALSSQCSIKFNVLSKEQVKEMNIKNLEKRLAKLKSE